MCSTFAAVCRNVCTRHCVPWIFLRLSSAEHCQQQPAAEGGHTGRHAERSSPSLLSTLILLLFFQRSNYQYGYWHGKNCSITWYYIIRDSSNQSSPFSAFLFVREPNPRSPPDFSLFDTLSIVSLLPPRRLCLHWR